jgi:hypothetical protein
MATKWSHTVPRMLLCILIRRGDIGTGGTFGRAPGGASTVSSNLCARGSCDVATLLRSVGSWKVEAPERRLSIQHVARHGTADWFAPKTDRSRFSVLRFVMSGEKEEQNPVLSRYTDGVRVATTSRKGVEEGRRQRVWTLVGSGVLCRGG